MLRIRYGHPMRENRHRRLVKLLSWIALGSVSASVSRAATLSGTFDSITKGSSVPLTAEGPVDWVHWGLYTESSLDRKSGVTPLISDFTLLDATNGYSYVYQFADNWNGYNWSDGTPTTSI